MNGTWEVLLWLFAPKKAEMRMFSACADHAPATVKREKCGGQIPNRDETVGSHTAPNPRRGGAGGLDALIVGAEPNPALSPHRQTPYCPFWVVWPNNHRAKDIIALATDLRGPPNGQPAGQSLHSPSPVS